MKLKHPQPSTPLQTSELDEVEAVATGAAYFYEGIGWLFAPTPPTMAAIKRAKFVDKTYVWRRK